MAKGVPAALVAISLGLRRALRLGLRIADSLGQHLAQLGFRLRRLAREGFLPLGHRQYVGMPERELNPYGRLALAPSCETRYGSGWGLRTQMDNISFGLSILCSFGAATCLGLAICLFIKNSHRQGMAFSVLMFVCVVLAYVPQLDSIKGGFVDAKFNRTLNEANDTIARLSKMAIRNV